MSNQLKRLEGKIATDTPFITRSPIVVEHVRINSARSFDAVRTELVRLPRFDDRIRVLLHFGDAARVKVELEKLQGIEGLTLFSVATHGDWLQIKDRARNALQYVIGNVLISTQMTQHEPAAGLYARFGSCSMRSPPAWRHWSMTARQHSLVSMATSASPP